MFLTGKSVTDDHLAHVENWTSLTHLHLPRTSVTDAGLAHLKNLTQLTKLVVYGTEVTDEGRLELMRAIPGLRIR